MSAPFNLALGQQVFVQIIAYNIYGNSSLSTLGGGAIIVSVPDAPLNLANNVVITNAT